MTRHRLLSIPLALVLIALAATPAVAADSPAQPSGSFLVHWEKVGPPFQPIVRKLRRSGAVQRVVAEVNRLVAIPRTVPIVFTDKTDVGPAYLPDQNGRKLNVIVFPGTFLARERDALRQELHGVKGLSLSRVLTHANEFIIAHEIGHALVSELKIPVTGREEDAVDGFAAYLLAGDKRFGALAPLSAALLFDALKSKDSKLGQSDFADEHSLPQQRVYQFLCWVYGSDTKRFADMVGEDLLPRDRAVRCPAEYRQLRSSWNRLLAPYRRSASSPADPDGTPDRHELPAVLQVQGAPDPHKMPGGREPSHELPMEGTWEPANGASRTHFYVRHEDGHAVIAGVWSLGWRTDEAVPVTDGHFHVVLRSDGREAVLEGWFRSDHEAVGVLHLPSADDGTPRRHLWGVRATRAR